MAFCTTKIRKKKWLGNPKKDCEKFNESAFLQVFNIQNFKSVLNSKQG